MSMKDEKEVVKRDDLGKDEGSFNYHISLNKDENSEFYKIWRVRRSNSDKTIKYFDTQKEAIAYAKSLSDKNKTNIVIHKTDGKIRKQKY